MAEPSKPLRRISSYGRNRGRKLGPHRSRLENELLPKLLLDPSFFNKETSRPISLELFPICEQAGEHAGEKQVQLEIGFGSGEHLAMQAERYPNIGFIGCEPYITAATKLLSDIEQKQLDNIRLYNGDARDLMAGLPDHSVDQCFILFPDPWPKLRHHKRRLINHHLLDELARVLKPGAKLLIATDHEDYLTWILEHLLARTDFIWQARRPIDWQHPPKDWVTTKYQAKALREGRVPHWLQFIVSQYPQE